MMMLEVFAEVLKELPIELNVITVRCYPSLIRVYLEHDGNETSADLWKRDFHKGGRDYCWYVAATALSTIYIDQSKYEMARFWLDAAQNKELLQMKGEMRRNDNLHPKDFSKAAQAERV